MTGLITGADGERRCPWPGEAPDYLTYHDDEWGRPVHGDDAVFERIVLEGFQSGLSWITILRKREAFREAFAGFSVEKIAAFGPDDVERLMGDAGIVRNRAKITAAIGNAQAAAQIPGGISALVWSFAPKRSAQRKRKAPRTMADLAATTPESVRMATELRRLGFRYVGPTTAYAHMQATGMVDDHLQGCFRRGAYAANAS